jgi:FMN phosphatase YigB (HAD superfamily)
MKFIALDIGNVLCLVKTQPFIDFLSETFNISTQDAVYFLKRFQRIHDLGYTTMESELREKFGTKSEVTINKVVSAWNDAIIPYTPILDKFNELREKHNLQVALLSNIGVEHAIMMEEKLKHEGFFPNVIKHFSCDVGARKPSMIYYQSFLLEHPNFEGCIYVDDLQENLDAGAKFKFKPFKFDLNEPDVEGKIKELEALIINSGRPGKAKNSRWH